MMTSRPRFILSAPLCALIFALNCISAATVFAYDNPVDDFYMTHYGQAIHMFVADNDGVTPGWGHIEQIEPQAQHGFLAWQYEVFYAYNPLDYTGMDYFHYHYRIVDDPPTYGPSATVYIADIGTDGAQNAGNSCPTRPPNSGPAPPVASPNAGHPVNVTNGNMWLSEQDYMLPGPGEPIHVDRFYNSIIKTTGLFGIGWTTQYDESLTTTYDGPLMLRLNAPDGRASYFGRTNTSDPFVSLSQGMMATIVESGGTFSLFYKDGRVHHFDSTGKLTSLADHNGLETVLHYTSGVLDKVTDAVGRELLVDTLSNGRVWRIRDSIGTVATYEYFASPNDNKLKTVTYPDGSKYKFEYIDIGSKHYYLTTVKDALNNVLEAHDYDTRSGTNRGKALSSERDGGAEALTFEYTADSEGPLTIVTDALEHQTKYHYKTTWETNLITKTEGVCGCGGGGSEVTQYEYDEQNSRLNLKKITDALGHETNYTYDAARNITQITDVLGTQTFTYNSLGEVLTATDRMSGTTTNTYSSVGNLLTSTDPLSHTTTLTYNTLGRVATVTDARSKVTTLSYNSYGLLNQVSDANSKHTNFAYDDRARLTSVTNALSQTTSFGYDDNNRLASVTYPDTHHVNLGYDTAGRRTSVTDENGHATTYAYDAAYRLTGITDALSHTTSFGYDDMFNLTSQTDALGNVTNLEYDDFNRLKKVVYPVPSPSASPRLQETFTYDQLGELASHTDTAGHTTSYAYTYLDGPKRRVIAVTQPSPFNYVTQFTYNARMQMTKVKDALNQEYNFTYDPLGRELSEARGSNTMSFGYDAVGNRTSRTDFNGAATTYAYDNLNRLTGITYGGSSEFATYVYDDLSRLTSAENQNGTVEFAYDNRGRLTTETDVWGHDITRSYDPAGNRTGLSLDSSTFTTYAYDAANRLTTLTDEASGSYSFGYDDANRLTSRSMPNGVNSTYEYDGMSRLKRLKHVKSTTALYDDQYAYNSANQISQIVGLSQTRNFTYDNINRLTAMSDGTNNESYSYDAVGNRTASHLTGSYYTSAYNRMTIVYPYAVDYDNNGNMTSWVNSELPLTTEVYGGRGWDNENRLTLVDVDGSDVTYSYDALGRRISRNSVTDRTINMSYDGLDVIMDDDGASNLTKYQNAPGIDNKLKVKSGSTSKYFLQDHLGSTVALTNSSGAISESNSYDSFGNPTNTSFATRFQFTGREYDSFTGLQYNRARWYSPQIGRFISEDPIGFRGGNVNLYGYVKNNPVGRKDALGLLDPGDWQAAQAARQAAASGGGAALFGGGLAGLAGGLGAYGAAAAPWVGVGIGGFGAGYAIGYYPGQWTANSPFNPYVNGPLNPFGTPYPMLPPWAPTSATPRCETKPRVIPWTRSPLPADPDDECDAQLDADREICDRITDTSEWMACHSHAMQRYAACLRGQPIPHNPWREYPWE